MQAAAPVTRYFRSAACSEPIPCRQFPKAFSWKQVSSRTVSRQACDVTLPFIQAAAVLWTCPESHAQCWGEGSPISFRARLVVMSRIFAFLPPTKPQMSHRFPCPAVDALQARLPTSTRAKCRFHLRCPRYGTVPWRSMTSVWGNMRPSRRALLRDVWYVSGLTGREGLCATVTVVSDFW